MLCTAINFVLLDTVNINCTKILVMVTGLNGVQFGL